MADFTPEQMRRMHDFAEQLSELAEHQEDQWKVQTTDGQIFLTMRSPTAPHGLTVMRLRRQIEAQTADAATLSDTNMGDPVTGVVVDPPPDGILPLNAEKPRTIRCGAFPQ
ncbi:hypothetical protein KPP03845_103126 [Streptomyces xanthophaeus]|uniref:hypothetical protein n=1 Tax=Streptomyces xanthophaeus TaxID=67385 RepID=UPI00233EE0B8|nr:hypothetical protein [Streptomyces xanthophaeus]WCD86767.1 hypothetical protein KPP03845_103126 [Streptomyces xanthophaeus]